MSAPDFYAIQGEAIAECQRLLAETGSSGSVTLTIARLAYEAGARDERAAWRAGLLSLAERNENYGEVIREAMHVVLGERIDTSGGGNG